MTPTPVLRRRGLGARLVPLVVALGALPLMAPTCGSPGEGYKVFSRLSLIIPMDVCYQYQTDALNSSFTPAPTCPQATDPGSVIKAYGLVYELIRAGVPVYWVIQQGKSSVTAIDLTVSYSSGPPALLYNWSTGGQGAAATANPSINYRGGPFVVDGSDYARASAVLQQYASTFSSVNVHVANVAFRGYVKRTMAGGWSAGGAIPPKLALLDIGSSGAGSKNSEYVIEGYLAQAGLDTANAGGTTAGPHGQIYDHLYMPDFIPSVAGDWHTTTLYQNGYQILWVPHWAAPSSCSDCPPGPSCTCSVKYDAATIATALKTIGAFSAEGGDVFAECAGLGSFEGVFSSSPPNTSNYSSTYVLSTEVATGGEPTTHFQTVSPTGVWINKSVGAATLDGSFDSPFMQLGDYPFTARTGAIQNYKPSAYKNSAPEVTTKLISDATDGTYDIFTLLPRTSAHGTIVYLGGHSYSGNDGSFEIAGTRLVLNTLFNLGATCTATGLPCNTGLFGVCAAGVWSCDTNGQPFCQQTVFPSPEVCNGLDDNCNGAVDEGLTTSCYSPPAGYVDPLGRTGAAFTATQTVGVCQPGVSSCVRNADGTFGMSACIGQVLPSTESCNGLDDDCDGVVDDNVAPRSCYDGPQYSLDANGIPKGTCKMGTQTCQSGAWGAVVGGNFTPGVCAGEVLPQPETCPTDPSSATTALDYDCDGTIISCSCTDGTIRPCFSGPGTPGVGICQAGTQTCSGGVWGECTGEVDAILYEPEPCTTPAAPAPPPGYVQADDWNCDGFTKQCAECSGSETQSCWGPDPGVIPSIAGRGQCTWGTRTCSGGAFGPCQGYGFQSTTEYCDGTDNNCNGPRVASPLPGPGGSIIPADSSALTTLGSPPGIDDNAVCPAGSTCLRGVCVPSACGTERPPPEGYACSSGTVVPSTCGDLPDPEGCPTAQQCQYGTCINPCPVDGTGKSLVCASGTVCGGGACIAGGCYEAGCPSGQLCLGGACVTNPCASVTCPSGTFCRQGDCVQACTFVSCAAGQKCGIDGFCVADPCAGRTCGAGQQCVGGTCVADPCSGLSCAVGQVCDSSTGAAMCVDDPCTGVVCPAGVCIRGQCFATGNLTGAGTAHETTSKSGGCSCGSGGGVALPALLALLALPLTRRRRRGPGGAGAPGGRGVLLVALLSVALLASACKQSKTQSQFDPSGCAATCGEQRCVDLTSDPTHCGGCSIACGASQQCVDSVCGPTTAVAPYIQSLSPTTGAKDDSSLTLTLTGQRFEAGATVRMGTPLGPRTVTCPATPGGACQVVSAGTILVTVDLTGISPGGTPFTLRVVNPDLVISNSVTLGIFVPVPAIAGVVPNTVTSGTTATLDVSPTGSPGTGFTSGSQCHLQGAVIGDIGLPTTLAPAPSNDLLCQLDTSSGSGVPPGSYQLTVVSEAVPPVRSNSVTVTVTPSDPVVFTVTPDAAGVSSTVSLTVTGARFDASSRVLFSGTSIPTTTFVDSGHLFVASYQVPGTAGLYNVAVQNGSGTPSNSVTFTVGNVIAPTVSSFSPPTAYQGDPEVVLTFLGSGLPPDATIEVEPPGATVFSALPSATAGCGGAPTTCTQVTTTAPDLSLIQSPGVPAPEGTWLVRVRLGAAGSATLAPWPLRVLSNQAVLRSYSAAPSPALSGMVGDTKTGFTFDAANLQGWPDLSGVRVAFFDPAYPGTVIHLLTPSPTPTSSATTMSTPGFSLAGLAAGVYAFTVNNPNATASNALTFSVTPGPPTLASICLAGTSCVKQVAQSSTPTTVTLTGTNFAAPDQYGNNGSVVMVASAYSPSYPAGDPCNATTTGTQFQQVTGTINVLSSSQMNLTFDTRQAYVDPSGATTYYVSIWNPSGTGPLLKSDCTNATPPVDPRTLPYFKITQ